MSSISGVGSSLFTYFQGVSGTSQAGQTSATGVASQSASGVDADHDGDSGVQGHGHGHRGHGSFGKVADAVTSALQSAQSGSDPNQVIKDAIAKVLGQAGQSSASPTTQTSGSASATQASSSDPDGDGDTQSPGQVDNDASKTSFLKTLQSFGVDPQQFRQDFLAALGNAGGTPSAGSIEPFPPGSLVNVAA